MNILREIRISYDANGQVKLCLIRLIGAKMGSYLEWGILHIPVEQMPHCQEIIPWVVGPASTHFALKISGTLTLKHASANGLS